MLAQSGFPAELFFIEQLRNQTMPHFIGYEAKAESGLHCKNDGVTATRKLKDFRIKMIELWNVNENIQRAGNKALRNISITVEGRGSFSSSARQLWKIYAFKASFKGVEPATSSRPNGNDMNLGEDAQALHSKIPQEAGLMLGLPAVKDHNV